MMIQNFSTATVAAGFTIASLASVDKSLGVEPNGGLQAMVAVGNNGLIHGVSNPHCENGTWFLDNKGYDLSKQDDADEFYARSFGLI
jgi:hypothetical protein